MLINRIYTVNNTSFVNVDSVSVLFTQTGQANQTFTSVLNPTEVIVTPTSLELNVNYGTPSVTNGVTATATINYSNGDLSCSAVITLINNELFAPKLEKTLTFDFYNGGMDYLTYTTTEPIVYSSYGFFNSFNTNDFTFEINGLVYPFNTWLINIGSASVGSVLRIQKVNSNVPDGEVTLRLNFSVNSVPTVAPYYTHTLDFSNAKVGVTAAIHLKNTISFNTNTSTHSAMMVGLRVLGNDLDSGIDFKYDLKVVGGVNGINQLNADILTLGENIEYVLDFWGGIAPSSTTSFPNGGWQPLTSGNQDHYFSYTFNDISVKDLHFIEKWIGENNQPNYPLELAGLSEVYNGVNRYDLINNFPTNLINNGSPFTLHLEFFCDDISSGGVDGFRSIFTTEYGLGGTGAKFFSVNQVVNIGSLFFQLGTNNGFGLRFPLKQDWNTLIFSYAGNADAYISGAGLYLLINGAPIYNFFKLGAISSGWSCWNGITTRGVIGSVYQQGSGAFAYHKGRVKNITIFADPTLVSPTDTQSHKLSMVRGGLSVYNPSAALKAIFNFDSGVTIDPASTPGLTVLSQGLQSSATYLI